MAPATKRAAPKAPSSPARASKMAKKDHFGEACMGILAVLEQDASLSDAARSMLAAAAPWALRSSKEERHSYQATTVAMLADIFSKVEAGRKKAVSSLEAKAAECAAGKASCASSLSAAKDDEVSTLGLQQEAKKAMEEAHGAIPKAKKAVADAKAAEGNLEKQHEQDKAAKLEREQLLADTWTRLKESSFPGKEWQLRKKKTEVIVAVLDMLDVESSLKLALPVALKTKAEERGVFGQKSVECVDAILQKSLQAMEAKIAAHEATVSEAKAVIAAAEEALAKAKATEEEGQNAFVSAENVHVKSVDALNSEKESLKKLEASERSALAELDAAKEELTGHATLQTQFGAFTEGGAAAAEPKALEPEVVDEPITVADEAPAAEAAEVVA